MLCENSAMKLEHWSIQHLHRELLSNATTVVEAFESKNGSVLKIENDDNGDNDDYEDNVDNEDNDDNGDNEGNKDKQDNDDN